MIILKQFLDFSFRNGGIYGSNGSAEGRNGCGGGGEEGFTATKVEKEI